MQTVYHRVSSVQYHDILCLWLARSQLYTKRRHLLLPRHVEIIYTDYTEKACYLRWESDSNVFIALSIQAVFYLSSYLYTNAIMIVMATGI